jgi:hypothetical protein
LCFYPLFLLKEFCRYLLGKTEKAGRATVFLYWYHQVWSCIAYDVISILHVLIKKKLGEFARFFFGISDNCMYFLLISQFFVHLFTLLRYNWEFMTIICQVFSCICKSRIASFLMRWKMCTIHDFPKGTSFLLWLCVSRIFG